MTHDGKHYDIMHPVVMHYVTRLMALQNGVSAVLLGTLLAMPWDTFGASTAYRILASKGSEEQWAFLFISLGILQLCAHKLPFTWLLRVPMMLCWLYLAFVFALGDYRLPGWPNYLWDGIFAGALFVLEGARAMRDLHETAK